MTDSPEKSTPSDPAHQPLQIGSDSLGRWVVRDPCGTRGGIFLKRADAFRFATADFGLPRMAVLAPCPFEFGRANAEPRETIQPEFHH